MAHEFKKLYSVTNPVNGREDWTVECVCDWKEKGLSKADVDGRLAEHIRRPHQK
jgi:hypothetical protein